MTIETLVPEQLWQAIQPLLPPPPRRYGGRPRVDDRAALAGIVYQLRTGVPWRLLPPTSLAAAAQSLAGGGCGTGSAPDSQQWIRERVPGFREQQGRPWPNLSHTTTVLVSDVDAHHKRQQTKARLS